MPVQFDEAGFDETRRWITAVQPRGGRVEAHRMMVSVFLRLSGKQIIHRFDPVPDRYVGRALQVSLATDIGGENLCRCMRGERANLVGLELCGNLRLQD